MELRYNKNKQLKSDFGISIYTYQDMLEKQGGVCAVCKGPEIVMRNGVPLMLAVDHDHVTGKVRGLLCSACNLGLGIFKDSTSTLKAAIEYLNK